MGSGFTISTCPPSGCSRKLLSSRGKKEQERIRPFKMFPLCVIYPLRKSHFSSPRGISVIYNAKLLYRRWQFVFSIVFSRWHQGHRLSSDKDVYATPQHWDKITPLHQVSATCGSATHCNCLTSFASLRGLLCSQVPSYLCWPSSHPAAPLSVCVPLK